MANFVKVSVIPSCDFCTKDARYDAATNFGPWANMCQSHFYQFGIGLGPGRGQTLELEVA